MQRFSGLLRCEKKLSFFRTPNFAEAELFEEGLLQKEPSNAAFLQIVAGLEKAQLL